MDIDRGERVGAVVVRRGVVDTGGVSVSVSVRRVSVFVVVVVVPMREVAIGFGDGIRSPRTRELTH